MYTILELDTPLYVYTDVLCNTQWFENGASLYTLTQLVFRGNRFCLTRSLGRFKSWGQVLEQQTLKPSQNDHSHALNDQASQEKKNNNECHTYVSTYISHYGEKPNNLKNC